MKHRMHYNIIQNKHDSKAPVSPYICANSINNSCCFFITGQFQRGMQMNPLGLLWILWAAYLVVMRYGFGKKAKGLMTAAGVIVVLMVAVYLYRMYCFFPGEPPISYTSGSLAERLIPGYRKWILGVVRMLQG